MSSMTLDDIGLKYGTDKASNGHDYLRIYDGLIDRNWSDTRLLEIGWDTGASMRMWREWLHPHAVVVGVDIEEKEPIMGVYFEEVDATSPAVSEVVGDYGWFDVIVDDGSHLSEDVIATFLLLWPHVKPGGLYIVEDLHVAYHRDWHGADTRTSNGGPMSSMHFLKNLADEPHRDHAGAGPTFSPIVTGIESIAFHPGLAVIRKADVR